MSNKPLLFISHISEEKNLALKFKELIDEAFLGMIDVFVSSDENSIQMGQRWLDKVSNALKSCAVEIVICSPISVKRPWINFEAGAGWVRDIPVIPLCHSGMNPTSLPNPLNLLQAGLLSDIGSMKLVFPLLATSLGSSSPNVDLVNFVDFAKNFEDEYTFWGQCRSSLADIAAINAAIIPTLCSGQSVTLSVSDHVVNNIQPSLEFLKSKNIISTHFNGSSSIDSNGFTRGWVISPLSDFTEITKDPRSQI